MRKYNQFILEKLNNDLVILLEGYLYSTSEFHRKISELSRQSGRVGDISKIIDEFLNRKADPFHQLKDDSITQNFFDTTNRVDMVSFTMNDKVPKDWDNDEDPDLPYTLGRSEMKIGRVLRSIVSMIQSSKSINFNLTDKDVEDFVNAYKSLEINDKWQFKIVKGDDIIKYYNTSNYLNTNGTLGGSCMGDARGKLKLYVENDNKVGLLILHNKETDQICGRALVWKLKKSPCDAKYFMDRVYVNNDSDVIKFKNFANENKFLYKQKMNSHTETNVCFLYDNKEFFGEISVKLEKSNFNKYPFIDTLCFLKGKKLSNLPSKNCNWLHETDGGDDQCYECDGECFSSYNGICDVCGDGHIFLKRKGIETKINRLV
jgi:hypothetical protein